MANTRIKAQKKLCKVKAAENNLQFNCNSHLMKPPAQSEQVQKTAIRSVATTTTTATNTYACDHKVK